VDGPLALRIVLDFVPEVITVVVLVVTGYLTRKTGEARREEMKLESRPLRLASGRGEREHGLKDGAV